MVFDWVLLVVGVAGAAFVLFNARRLGDRPRRGTEWRPSYRGWLVVAGALILIAVGALMNLVSA